MSVEDIWTSNFLGRPIYLLYKSPAAAVLSSGEAELEDGSKCGTPELISRQIQGQHMPVPVLGITCEILAAGEKILIVKALCVDDKTPQIVYVPLDSVHSITSLPEHVGAEPAKPKVIL